MYATREEMKKEAIERLKLLDSNEEIIADFEKGKITVHFPIGTCNALNAEDKAKIAEIEEKNGGMVYAVIRDGFFVNYLYISKYKEDWEYDHYDIPDGIVFSWVENPNMPDCSEFGSIGVKTYGGWLQRVQ